MAPPSSAFSTSNAAGGFLASIVIAIVLAGVVALLFAPMLPLPLTGDSYQWIQHAHLAAHRPALQGPEEDCRTFEEISLQSIRSPC